MEVHYKDNENNRSNDKDDDIEDDKDDDGAPTFLSCRASGGECA